MTYSEFVQSKKQTELGNTLYQRAVDQVEDQQHYVKKTFFNPYQFAVTTAKAEVKKSDEEWKAKMIDMRLC